LKLTVSALWCVLTIALAGLGAGGAAAGSTRPAVGQLQWVVGLLNRSSPPSAVELRRHFAPSFLKALPPQRLLAALYPAWSSRPVRLQTITVAQQTRVVATLAMRSSHLRATVAVDPTGAHPIVGLLLEPLAAKLSSWAAIDSSLSRLGARAAIYVGVAGSKTVHALHASAPLAVGSAFKLYVLGALGQAIEQGRATWQQQLAISDAHKSLPAGGMAAEPPGARHSLRDFAAQMISVSDNTAADDLIERLGRAAVERQLVALGNRSPRLDEPFLTTRELFALKVAAPAGLRRAYAAGDSARRRALLEHVDTLTPTQAEAAGWTAPRLSTGIEWFASTADLARAISALIARSETPKLSPIRAILAMNPGLALDRSVWTYVAFKGGSEPGVLSMTWYLERHDGAHFTVSLIVNDPRHEIDESAAISVAQAAIDKLAQQ
jgi:beta-lactamase class A